MDKTGHITIFSRNFCLTVPKNFVRESYCFSENFWFRKVLWMKRGRGVTFLRRKFLVSQCRIISWASLQCFRKFGVSKKIMHYVSQCQEISWASLQCFRKFGVSKNFMHQRGGVPRFSVENFLSHSADKIRRRKHRKNSGIGKFQAKDDGSFTVLSKKFSSHRTEEASPGKVCVSENFW